MKYTVPTGRAHCLLQQWNADYHSFSSLMDSHMQCQEALPQCSSAAQQPLFQRFYGQLGWEQKDQRGAQRYREAVRAAHIQQLSAAATLQRLHCLTDQTKQHFSVQSRCSFVILKLLNRNFNSPALIPTQIKGFYAQCSLHFLAAAWGKAMWKSCSELS